MNQIKRLMIVSLGLSVVMFGIHAAQQQQIHQMEQFVQQFQQLQLRFPLYITPEDLEPSQQFLQFMVEPQLEEIPQ